MYMLLYFHTRQYVVFIRRNMNMMQCIYFYIYIYIDSFFLHIYLCMHTHNYVSKSSGQHLLAFWSQHLQSRPMVLGGASLGGGIAMDFAVEHPEVCYRFWWS